MMRISVIALALLLVSACGGDDAEPATTPADAAADTATATDTTTPTDTATPATDSATPDTATTTDVATDAPSTACMGAPDAGAKCNELVNGATNVVLSPPTMAIPTGTGGTPVDGKYFLTAFQAYTGSPLPAGQTMRQTLELCAGIGQFVNNEPGKPEAHKTFTFKPMGTAPNTKQTCSTQMPDVEIPYASYTATATTLTFYSTAFNFSVTYTKQ